MTRWTLVPAVAVDRGMANRRSGWARLSALTAVLGLLFAPSSGCGSRTSELTGGETHWLSACDAQKSCGDGLACICGRCSISCSSDTVCRELAPLAACLPTEKVTDTEGCGNPERRICGELAEADAGEPIPPALISDASAHEASDAADTEPTNGSSEGAPSASTQAQATDGGDAMSQPPSALDGLPAPEGWGGLKLIDPYADECVITDSFDRNTQPNGEEGMGYLRFACSGGPELTALCMLEDDGQWECDCFGDGGRTANSNMSFEDVGWTESQACRLAGALCVTELPEEVARAQESCTLGAPTINPDSCEHQADCVRTTSVGDLEIEQTLENQATCSWEGDDVARCSCTGLVGSTYGFSVSPVMSDASCGVATSLCNNGVDTGSLGAIECTLDPELSAMDELWCDEV
jgi:hypothetical protein